LTHWPLSFWYEGYDFNQETMTYTEDVFTEVNQEQIYYNQYALLNDALNGIRPGENGLADLFFIGFGSDSAENVFRTEIEHMHHAVNARLGATGRSLKLINNLETIDELPLASSHNLKISLHHLGKKINQDEDIVFLYLTGHGSADHTLQVQMQPLSLNDLSPRDIKNYLDEAGIRWRIIVISACYSGGFIESLQNEHSLIFTAAAAHKTSFGCSIENENTYFGEALRNSLTNQPFQYVQSFVQAMQMIGEREQYEKLIPSEPQLFIGNQMREKLKVLEQDMTRYAPERFGAM
ncbi:MAG: C13 family peptidase, partial [Nitrosomonas sp.]